MESRKQLASTVREYVRWCEERGLIPFPVSYDAVAGYIKAYVLRQGGATHSVKNVKSRLRVFCRHAEFSWLTEGEAARLLALEKLIAFQDCSEVKKAAPLTCVLLVAILEFVDTSEPFYLMMVTTLYFGHDGILRGGEVWSGIKSRQIAWHSDGRGFDLLLWRTKTHRSGGFIRISYRESGGSINAVVLMRAWFKARSLWDKPDADLWLGIHRTANGFGFGPSQKPSANKAIWVEALRFLLYQMGLEGRIFSGHSLRVGGACDLFDSGFPLAWIMRVGRWKTAEAALEYYRDNHAMADEVSRIFAECGKRQVRK